MNKESLQKRTYSLKLRIKNALRIKGTYSLVATRNTFEDIIKQFLDKFGHMGIQRCFELILTRYFWPHMEKTISEHIGGCRQCTLPAQREKWKRLCFYLENTIR